MASKPREYWANEPVAVETRCAWRVHLLDDARIAENIQRIAAIEAVKTRVKILALTIELNHLHLLLVQDLNGHDPERRVGIAAFMRNFASRVAKWLNGVHGFQGRFWERVYRSHRKTDADALLASLVYTVMNPVRHGAVRRAENYGFNGSEVYFDAEPDGVITHVPAMIDGLGKTPQERARRIRELMEEIWREGGPKPGEPNDRLLDAARQALRRHRNEIDRSLWRKMLPVGDWVGGEPAEMKRKAVVARKPIRSEFQRRRAPRLGEAVHVVLQLIDPRPLASAAWREWHT